MQDEAGPYRKGYLDALRDVSATLLEIGPGDDPLVRRLLDYVEQLVARLDDPPDERGDAPPAEGRP